MGAGEVVGVGVGLGVGIDVGNCVNRASGSQGRHTIMLSYLHPMLMKLPTDAKLNVEPTEATDANDPSDAMLAPDMNETTAKKLNAE